MSHTAGMSEARESLWWWCGPLWVACAHDLTIAIWNWLSKGDDEVSSFVLRTVDRRMPPDVLIETPQMEAVRRSAAEALALVDVSG